MLLWTCFVLPFVLDEMLASFALAGYLILAYILELMMVLLFKKWANLPLFNVFVMFRGVIGLLRRVVILTIALQGGFAKNAGTTDAYYVAAFSIIVLVVS